MDISLTDYAAANKNILQFVTRPDCCPGCGSLNAFHSHGNYSRFVNDFQIYVARFRCRFCAFNLSILPSFAMPYKNKSTKVVDRYFLASNTERRNFGNHDSLRFYWKAWLNNWQIVFLMIGESADCARSAWTCLIKRFKSIESAQCELINRHSQALLKRYGIHDHKINDGFVQ